MAREDRVGLGLCSVVGGGPGHSLKVGAAKYVCRGTVMGTFRRTRRK